MGLLNIATKLAGAKKVYETRQDPKKRAIMDAEQKRVKEEEQKALSLAASKQSFKSPTESANNPNSDYYNPTQIQRNTRFDDVENELLKYPTEKTYGGEVRYGDNNINWTNAEDNELIRKELANNSKGSVAQKYIKAFGLSEYEKKAKELNALEDEVEFNRRYLQGKDPMSAQDYAVTSIPFGIGPSIKRTQEWLDGVGNFDIKRKAKQITDAEGTTRTDYGKMAGGFVATLPLQFGVYGAVEKGITAGVSAASKANQIAKSINQMRLTSPKLFAVANNTLSEVAEYGVRKVVDNEFTSSTDLLMGIGMGGVFGSLFGGKSVKGVADSFTRKDVVEIEKLIPEGTTSPSAALDAIKDYKLDNGFTVSEVQDALKTQGKTKLLKNKTITEDDVLMSLENGLNGSLVNQTTARRIAGAINQAKADIDNAKPTGVLNFGGNTDEGASQVVNDIITQFSIPGKVYTTDDAADVINGIVAKYGKKYKLDDADGSIDDLLFDIRAMGNGNKLSEVDSLDALYKLAGKKSEDVKMGDIIDLRKKVEKYEQLTSTKAGAKVKMDKTFGAEVQKLADEANYTSPINVLKKDGSIDIDKAYKVLDDIEAHSFTNSTRFRSVMKNNEDVFMSKIGLKQKTKRGAITSVNTRIKLIDKDRKEAIKIGDDVIKQITLDPNSLLSKPQRTSIYNQMRGQLSSANSYTDVKAIVKKATQKMWVTEVKKLLKDIDSEFKDSAKKMKSRVSYAEVHEDIINTIISSNEAYRATNDIFHLRDGLSKVRQMNEDGRNMIKEFDNARKNEVDNVVREINNSIPSDGRIEMGYEKGLIGRPNTTLGKSDKALEELQYPIRKIPELFYGEESVGTEVFLNNFVKAQTGYMKEVDSYTTKYYQLIGKAFNGMEEGTEYKYGIYSLYRRLIDDWGDSQRAKDFLLDSINIRVNKDGKFVYTDNKNRTDLFQMKQPQLESMLIDMDNLIRNNKSVGEYDDFYKGFTSNVGDRLVNRFKEEYDTPFPKSNNYFKLKYKGGFRQEIDDEIDAGMAIFNQPLPHLAKGFAQKAEGVSGIYGLELDPTILFNDVIRNQLRFIYFKKPLSLAVRTLNKLGGKDVSGSNKLDVDGFDELFKALELADGTTSMQGSKIGDGAYMYIKNFITGIANHGDRKAFEDTLLSKYIYMKFLSYNPSPIFSQLQSFAYMLPNGAGNLKTASTASVDTRTLAAELSGYLEMRRASALTTNEPGKIGFVEGWRAVMNKSKYNQSYSTMDGYMEVGLSAMKATDGVVSTNAWLQEAVRWTKENGFYTSGKFDLRNIIEDMSPEQVANMVASADKYMNRIMGASDEVSGKIFSSGISKSASVLGKANFNAYLNIWNQIGKRKGLAKAKYIIAFGLTNGLMQLGLESLKSEVSYRLGWKANNDLYPGILNRLVKSMGIETTPEIEMALSFGSRAILGFLPVVGPGVNLNEVFGIGAAAKDKIANAYEIGGARAIEQMLYAGNKYLLGNGGGNIINSITSLVFRGKSLSEVTDENYILSKLDINIDNYDEDKISELVGIKKDINKDYESGKSESAIKTTAKDELTKKILKEFDEVPSTQEFMQFVTNGDNKPLLIKAGLTDNVSGLKSFHNDLKLEKAKSQGEVISILGSADTEFIFNRRLKKYYDSGDILSYQKELNMLLDKGVIKNPEGFNNWMNKNVIQNTKYKKGDVVK